MGAFLSLGDSCRLIVCFHDLRLMIGVSSSLKIVSGA